MDIVYRVGKENFEADALSRAPIERYQDSDYQKAINMLTKDEIREFQKETVTNETREELEGIVVFRDEKGRVRVIVESEEMENELIKRTHEYYNHDGVDKILGIIRKGYKVRDLRKKLTKFTRQCETCIKNKASIKQSLGFLSRMGPTINPFQVVSIDTKGGFTGYKSAKKYLHLAIDHMTRYTWHITAKCQGENDLINLVKEVLKDGKPEVILCDRYGAMKSKKFRKF